MLPNHKLVDSHTHICDSSFDADRGKVLQQAAAAGVGAIIAIKAIAELKGVAEEAAIEAVNENTRRLYGNIVNI
jgi:Tat protein secretion system quality control protein TatD with DNase activity